MDQNQNSNQDDELEQSQQVGDQNADDDQQLDDTNFDTSGEQDDDQGDAGDDQDQDTQGDQRQTRQDRRIYKMTDNLRRTAQERDYYRNQLFQNQPEYKPLDYTSDQQFDRQQLEQDRSQFGTTQYVQGQREGVSLAKQELFVDRLELDTERVTTKYPTLDQDSNDFDPELTSDINELYLATVGYDQKSGQVRNPDIRYKDFAEKYMRNLNRMTSSRNADTARNVARQAGRQGMRPGGRVTRSNVDPTNPSTWRDNKSYTQNKKAIDDAIMRQIKAEGLGR